MFTRRTSRGNTTSPRSARQRRLGFQKLEPRYALVGDFQSAHQLISAQFHSDTIDTAYDSTGNLFVSSTYGGNANFDPTHTPGAPYNEANMAGFVAKYNTSGTLLWVNSFDSGSLSDVKGIAVDNNDNVIIAGRIRNSQDFDPSSGTMTLTTVNASTDNAFVAKYSSAGALVWAVQANTSSNAYVYDVACDSNGNIYATGYANGDFNGETNGGGADAFVWKLSSDGMTQWTNLAGGTFAENAFSLDVNAGRVVVGGNFFGTAVFDTGFTATSLGGRDAFVWVLDTAGTTQWAVSAGSNSISSLEYVNSVALDNTGKVYALGALAGTADVDPGTGTTSLNAGRFAWQLNADGSFAGGLNIDWSTPLDAITRGPHGDLYVTAYFTGTVDVDWGTGVRNLTDSTGDDFALLRYDPQGRLSGVTQVTGDSSTYYSAVAVNAAGQIAYLVRVYNGTLDLNPGSGTQNVSATTNTDIYLINLQEAAANVSLSAANLTENGDTSTVRVTLDHTRSEDVTINLGFSGSATLNVDYLASSNSIVIAAGQTSGSITLTALNDSAHEVGETILVNLASLYGARFGATTQATVTLADERARHLGDLVSTTQVISANALTSAVGAFYDASGNLLVAGSASNNGTVNFTPGVTPATTATGGSISNVLIAKYDTNGTLVWSHLLGGAVDTTIRSAQLDSQGNLIVAGYLGGIVDFDPSAGTTTLGNNSFLSSFVAKYSTTGSLLWATQPTASNTNITFEIAMGPVDEVYVVGRVTGNFNGQTNAGNTDAFVWKIASDGTTQWTKLAGSTDADQAYSIDVNSNGTIVVGGEFKSTATFAPGVTATASGAGDAFVWLLNSAGNTQWVVRAGGNSSGLIDFVGNLVLDDNGRIYAIAQVYGTADMDPGTGTANFSGQLLWSLNNDGTFRSAANVTFASKLQFGPRGDLYLIGDVFSTTDYDLGPGVTTVSDSGGATDYLLARYDSAGTLTGLSQWKTDVSMSSGMVLAFGPNGKLDVFLTIQGSTVDLDPGAGTQLFSAGPGDIVRVRLQEIAASVSSPSSAIAENGGTSTVRVTLDHTHSEPVTVDLSFGGTATYGVDYSASSNSLVIPAGQTSGSITLTSLDDSTYDASETISVSITSTYGALENGTQQITATITDDDRYIINGNSLTLVGTSGNDNLGLVRVGPNSFYTSYNGELVAFYNTTINHVVVNGQGGWDYFGILGETSITETVALGPNSFSYASTGLNVLSNAEQNVAFGQINDSATYADSAASDIIYMLPAYSIMYSIPSVDYINWTVGFGTTTANAGTGIDSLLFYGSAGPHTTFMTPTQSTLTMGGVTITANNFESQFSYGQSDDTVNLSDSSGNDNYFRLAAYGVLSTSAGIQEPIGFGTVNVTSSGGQDSAVLFESSGVDAYTGNANQAVFQTILETTTLNNFRAIYVYGTANDSATLNDSSGNDIFYGGTSQSTLIYASGRSHQVLGPQSITLSGVNGGIDTAFLDDSSGDDTLEVESQDRIRLHYGSNRTISVAAFDAVYARGTNGGRNTRGAGTLAFPGINFSGTWV